MALLPSLTLFIEKKLSCFQESLISSKLFAVLQYCFSMLHIYHDAYTPLPYFQQLYFSLQWTKFLGGTLFGLITKNIVILIFISGQAFPLNCLFHFVLLIFPLFIKSNFNRCQICLQDWKVGTSCVNSIYRHNFQVHFKNYIHCSILKIWSEKISMNVLLSLNEVASEYPNRKKELLTCLRGKSSEIFTFSKLFDERVNPANWWTEDCLRVNKIKVFICASVWTFIRASDL